LIAKNHIKQERVILKYLPQPSPIKNTTKQALWILTQQCWLALRNQNWNAFASTLDNKVVWIVDNNGRQTQVDGKNNVVAYEAEHSPKMNHSRATPDTIKEEFLAQDGPVKIRRSYTTPDWAAPHSLSKFTILFEFAIGQYPKISTIRVDIATIPAGTN
jgi:hypothetical protein